MVKKVVSLGEILLRLSPPQYQTLSQTSRLDCQFGGSELNVLATLAQLGHQVELISVIPDNDLGSITQQFLFSKQIGQNNVLRKGDRLGLYYYQKGFSLRASSVTYDRKYSVFWESCLDDYNLDTVFDDADWFHVSGITPALTENLYQVTMLLMKKAKEKGLKVSFDLNFRASLWDSFQEARELLSPFLNLSDSCFGLEPIVLDGEKTDLKDELGLSRSYHDKELLLKIVNGIVHKYQLEGIAFTQREMKHTNEYQLKGYYYDSGTLYETKKSSIQVLDRVETGDAFTAGLIHGILEVENAETALAMAFASFMFKHTIDGDINIISRDDIANMMHSENYEINR